MSSRETNLNHLSGSGVMMAAGRAGHPKLSRVWERMKNDWRRELTLRASLSNATVKVLVDNGGACSRLDQPWISVEANKGARDGFGMGCNVCCRMLGRNQALFPPH